MALIKGRMIWMTTSTNDKKKDSALLLANKVLSEIAKEGLAIGAHLKEVEFSNRLKVSRTPIRNAFAYLEKEGVVVKKPNQGYFLAESADARLLPDLQMFSPETSILNPLCYHIGQDYLSGKLTKSFTENELIARYEKSRKAIQEALITMEKEGWLSRSLGYGWEFNEFISSPKAYAQSYRFRQLIETQALREPDFVVNATKIQMLRMSQIEILNNDSKLVSAGDMFNAGVLFHETLVSMSGNIFLLDSLQRINRLRRLIEYNVNSKRAIPRKECEEHLTLLTLVEDGQMEEAAAFLEKHLGRTAAEKESIAAELFG
ncbi:GntR family transcriptional regulator [Vibrio alginolyticus]|nr:GntR family transcriptional regulator [Vibrio alginolyticus]